MEKIIEAIVTFRESNGTQWKRKLRELYWSGTNTNEYLQQFRNRYYGSLDKIKYHTTKEEIKTILEKA